MNDFGFIDYKAPIGKQNDMRTSTYLGHKHMTDTMLGNHMHATYKELKPYITDPKLAKASVSDYQTNYTWKFGNPNDVRNPSLDRRINYIKPFSDVELRFIKRPIRPATSVSHQDYLWRPEPRTEPPLPQLGPSPVATTQIIIDRAKPGYVKYLDPSATTSRLAFVPYTPQELMGGVGAKDNITFWNWNTKTTATKRVFPKRDEQMCDHKAAKECPKRRCEFPSLVKHVPNSGLTTEIRENFIPPQKRELEFDTTYIQNKLVHFPVIPFSTGTEYKLYGSGDRTQKFVG